MINNLPETMLAKLRVQECATAGLDGMCWIWTGCLNSKGYGCITFGKKRHLTHRVSYELHTGPIPAEMQIDHLCGQRDCFNPHHLEAVTAKENTRRAVKVRMARLAQEEQDDEDRAEAILTALLVKATA